MHAGTSGRVRLMEGGRELRYISEPNIWYIVVSTFGRKRGFIPACAVKQNVIKATEYFAQAMLLT